MPRAGRSNAGFSLFELVIVIMIIGVISAIAVPRASRAATGARDSAAIASARIMRRALDYYAVEHEGRSPAHDADWSINQDALTFEYRLTKKTKDTGSPGTLLGPYLRRLPENPHNALATIRIGGDPAGQGTHGWWYSPDRDVLLPDDSPESASEAVKSVYGHLVATQSDDLIAPIGGRTRIEGGGDDLTAELPAK